MNAFLMSCLVCFLIVGGTSLGDLEEPPVEVNAVQGEEVTFPVRLRAGFQIDEIVCIFKGFTIAKMAPGYNYTVRDENFTGRLYAMDENGSLQIRDLRTEDRGLYTIEIFNAIIPTEKEVNRYKMEIFRRVKPEISFNFNSIKGTCNITLNCTVGDEKGVSYKWRKNNVEITTEPAFNLKVKDSESNLTVCCTVKNPASSAIECVHPRKHCFQGSEASILSCGYPERIIACAAAIICALVGFTVYISKEQKHFDKQNSQTLSNT